MRSFLLFFLLAHGVSSSTQSLPDSSTVLQDLSKYSKLYVTYQNCAWSPYVDVDGDGGNACGVEGDGDSSNWYMGLTECFRSNVAFSLYGIVKGNEDKGCNKKTFINSYFTTSGIETFTNYLATAGVSFTAAEEGASEISSDCEAGQNENGENNENNAVDYNANNVKSNMYASSYGVGCTDTDKGFAMKKFAGAYCDERSAVEVTDTFATFNSEIGSVQCIAIYSETAAVAEDAEEGEGEAAEQQEQDGASAVGLLTYSKACDINLFPSKCPDPYGKLKSTSRDSAHASAIQQRPRRAMTKTVFSWLFMSIGVMLLVGSMVAYARKMQARSVANTTKKTKRSFNMFSMSKSQDGVEVSDAANRRGFFVRVKSMFTRK